MADIFDAEVRQQALNPHLSFAVAAPAGSGKTELLTQRVYRLLTIVDNPEEVLCLTFTRKAAAEMRERVVNGLLLAKEEKPQETHRAAAWELAHAALQRSEVLGWGLLENPARLNIGTIDGFCRRLALQLPLESGLGGIVDTLDNPRLAYRMACRQLFGRLSDPESDHGHALGQLFAHLDNDVNRIENLLVLLLERRAQWIPYVFAARDEDTVTTIQSTFSAITTDALSRLHTVLSPFAGSIEALIDYARENLADTQPDHRLLRCEFTDAIPAPTLENLATWQTVASFFLTDTGTWRKTLRVNEGFPPGKDKDSKANAKQRKEAFFDLASSLDQQADVLSLLKQTRTLPSADDLKTVDPMFRALVGLLPLLLAELTVSFKELGAVDYTAVTHGALAALGNGVDEFSELSLKLDYTIQHILVDECQDTSLPQYQLLEKLTAGWTAGDGRTLFLVGDGMQSIYSFRDANVGLFLNLREHGLPNVEVEPLDLTVNFRSIPSVVSWVNNAFAAAFPRQGSISQGLVPFSPSSPAKTDTNNGGVICHGIIDGNNDTTAAQVVELVKSAQAKDSQQSIAILVNSRSHLVSILPALKQANLTFSATEIDSLASRQCILDMMTLTQIINNPFDHLAWLAFLRAPWSGLSLADIDAIVNHRTNGNGDAKKPANIFNTLQCHSAVSQLSDEGTAILSRVQPLVSGALAQRRRKSLRESVQGLWLALGGPACLSNPNALQEVHTYLDLLETQEAGAQVGDWQTFFNAVESLYAAPDPKANPKLQIMTIHKSKGLEFDTVIIPGLEKAYRANDKALLLWQDWMFDSGERSFLMATMGQAGTDDSSLYRFLAESSKTKKQNEQIRLLYVAATRAIDELHLIANVVADTKKEGCFRKPPSNSLLSPIWETFEQNIIVCQPEVAIKRTDSDSMRLDGILRLPASTQFSGFMQDDRLASYRGHEYNDGANNIPDSGAFTNRHARYCGSVTHLMLKRFGEAGIPDSLENEKELIRSLLVETGASPINLNRHINEVIINLQKVIADNTGQWLLSTVHGEAFCEYEVLDYDQGETRKHIIDRTFVDKGVRWIIDYKCTNPLQNEPLQRFIAREKQTHAAQMQRYSKVFSKLGKEPIKTALYFPAIAEFAELSALDTSLAS